ncbi:MAG: hypothetical protein HZR80_18175 [Candidatus Heimdallarchaeota archaeon]
MTRWRIGGGSFFRVIANAPSEAKTTKLCIQYLILWTRQLFPFQFSFLSIPFFLGTLFFWQLSKYFPIETKMSSGVYLTLLITGFIFILAGSWTILEELYKRTLGRIKNWRIIPDSMIGFAVQGVLFWTTGIEYPVLQITRRTKFPAIIPISAWISLLVGVTILLIGIDFFLRGEKSFVERFSHPMDYAPLLLFLERDWKEAWQIEGTQFDFFHYKTTFVPKEKLVFEKDVPPDERTHPWFIIDRSWHAFREFFKPNIVLRTFSYWLVILAGLNLFILYVLVIWINWSFSWMLDIGSANPWVFTIVHVIPALIMFFIVWAFLRTREYELPMWEELSKRKSKEELLKHHHLTFERLRIQ